MTVTVPILGALRAYCDGRSEISVAAGSVREVLAELERGYPALYRNLCDERGAVRRHLNVFVNSNHMRDLEGLDTTLAAGDVVTFLPAVSGG
jgi:molybdopterin converting factor small subunit